MGVGSVVTRRALPTAPVDERVVVIPVSSRSGILQGSVRTSGRGGGRSLAAGRVCAPVTEEVVRRPDLVDRVSADEISPVPEPCQRGRLPHRSRAGPDRRSGPIETCHLAALHQGCKTAFRIGDHRAGPIEPVRARSVRDHLSARGQTYHPGRFERSPARTVLPDDDELPVLQPRPCLRRRRPARRRSCASIPAIPSPSSLRTTISRTGE